MKGSVRKSDKDLIFKILVLMATLIWGQQGEQCQTSNLFSLNLLLVPLHDHALFYAFSVKP